jgi:hypothetical protein
LKKIVPVIFKNQVSSWLAKLHGTTKEGGEHLECMLELDPGGLDRLLLHHELRRRFPTQIWTFDDDADDDGVGGFVVMPVTAAHRAELDAEESSTDLANRYVDFHRGFAQVSVADPRSGIRCFFTPCFRDQFFPDPGS